MTKTPSRLAGLLLLSSLLASPLRAADKTGKTGSAPSAPSTSAKTSPNVGAGKNVVAPIDLKLPGAAIGAAAGTDHAAADVKAAGAAESTPAAAPILASEAAIHVAGAQIGALQADAGAARVADVKKADGVIAGLLSWTKRAPKADAELESVRAEAVSHVEGQKLAAAAAAKDKASAGGVPAPSDGGSNWKADPATGKALTTAAMAAVIGGAAYEILTMTMSPYLQDTFKDFSLAAELSIVGSLASIIGRQIGPLVVNRSTLRGGYMVLTAPVIALSLAVAIFAASGYAGAYAILGLFGLMFVFRGFVAASAASERAIPPQVLEQDGRKLETFKGMKQQWLEVGSTWTQVIGGALLTAGAALSAFATNVSGLLGFGAVTINPILINMFASPVLFAVGLWLVMGIKIPAKIEAARAARYGIKPPSEVPFLRRLWSGLTALGRAAISPNTYTAPVRALFRRETWLAAAKGADAILPAPMRWGVALGLIGLLSSALMAVAGAPVLAHVALWGAPFLFSFLHRIPMIGRFFPKPEPGTRVAAFFIGMNAALLVGGAALFVHAVPPLLFILGRTILKNFLADIGKGIGLVLKNPILRNAFIISAVLMLVNIAVYSLLAPAFAYFAMFGSVTPPAGMAGLAGPAMGLIAGLFSFGGLFAGRLINHDQKRMDVTMATRRELYEQMGFTPEEAAAQAQSETWADNRRSTLKWLFYGAGALLLLGTMAAMALPVFAAMPAVIGPAMLAAWAAATGIPAALIGFIVPVSLAVGALTSLKFPKTGLVLVALPTFLFFQPAVAVVSVAFFALGMVLVVASLKNDTLYETSAPADMVTDAQGAIGAGSMLGGMLGLIGLKFLFSGKLPFGIGMPVEGFKGLDGLAAFGWIGIGGAALAAVVALAAWRLIPATRPKPQA